MQAEIQGAPAFCYIHIDLNPGESVYAEADAMAGMAADLDMQSEFNGGFIQGLLKGFLGGESLFINKFTNNTDGVRRLTIVQPTPGEVREIDLKEGETLCLQPGAFVGCTPGAKHGVKFAGFASWIGGEGLFKLLVKGPGKLWYGAYGGLIDKEVDGEYIVDSSHLVAYDSGLQLKVQLAGGLFSSFFSGEGLVTRVEGKGRITIQSRSLSGLAKYVNPRLW